jgi:hypothetical protein
MVHKCSFATAQQHLLVVQFYHSSTVHNVWWQGGTVDGVVCGNDRDWRV